MLTAVDCQTNTKQLIDSTHWASAYHRWDHNMIKIMSRMVSSLWVVQNFLPYPCTVEYRIQIIQTEFKLNSNTRIQNSGNWTFSFSHSLMSVCLSLSLSLTHILSYPYCSFNFWIFFKYSLISTHLKMTVKKTVETV